MGNISKINFVKDHQPGSNDVIELKNARFADVINGCFFDKDISVFIKSGKIISFPDLKHETSDIKPAFSIDLQGKTVLPGFFNVHCHIQMVNPTLFANFKTVKDKKRYHEQQVKKNMADCLARGITNIRDAYSDNLQPNRQLTTTPKKGGIMETLKGSSYYFQRLI